VLQEVCCKFILMIQAQSFNWLQFKEIAKSFPTIKDSMYNFAPEDMNETTLAQLMPLWK
jgi:hypothetical protein